MFFDKNGPFCLKKGSNGPKVTLLLVQGQLDFINMQGTKAW